VKTNITIIRNSFVQPDTEVVKMKSCPLSWQIVNFALQTILVKN